jgi:hypothetical protein
VQATAIAIIEALASSPLFRAAAPQTFMALSPANNNCKNTGCSSRHFSAEQLIVAFQISAQAVLFNELGLIWADGRGSYRRDDDLRTVQSEIHIQPAPAVLGRFFNGELSLFPRTTRGTM